MALNGCIDNHVDGLGIASEYVPPPDPGPVVPTAEERLAAVAAALNGIEEPVLSTDIVAAIREALT